MAFPLIGAIASIGSSLIGAYASGQAAKAQAESTKYAADLQRKTFQESSQMLKPQIDAGNTARGYQLGALGLPGGASYDEATSAFRTSPGYDFALKTGQNQVQTSAAAGGRLFSGKTLKDLTNYGQGMADQQFGNWFNRVGGIAGSGNAATNNQITLAGNNASSLGQIAMEGGNNQASSYIRGANALTGGIQNIADQYQYYNPPSWLKGAAQAGNFNNGFNPRTASQGFIT